MELSRVFADYMVLQRGMPILLWGHSDAAETVGVRLNGTLIAEAPVGAGAFSLTLPPQPAMEDATFGGWRNPSLPC